MPTSTGRKSARLTSYLGRTPRAVVIALMMVVFLQTGCGDKPTQERSSGFQLSGQKSQIQLNKQSDHLDRAISQIRNEDVTDWAVFEEKMTLALNNAWSTLKKAKQGQRLTEVVKDWQRPEILDTLPEAYQGSLWVRDFEDENFVYTDAYYLQEQHWLQQIVRQSREQSQAGRFRFLTQSDPGRGQALSKVLQLRDEALDDAGAERLALALQLFDWSLRNVSGDPFVSFPKEEWESERLQETAEDLPPSFAGIRGPGYSRYLWQILNYGRGDVWQQAHVFLQLARNADLDACVVGLQGAEATPLFPKVSHPDVIPWAIGVAVGGRLYLFEPRLGLPLLDPESRKVLTLQEVQERPEVLNWYSLTPQESSSEAAIYPVARDDLNKPVLLLDYPLECFSVRAKFVHDNLVGESRMPVYYPIQETVERLREASGNADVQLWALPLEINIFRGVVRDAGLRSLRDQFVARRLQWMTLEEKYFDQFPLLRESRVLFLQGKFTPDRTGLKRDCLQELQEMRYSDDEISQVATDRQLQEALGLYQQNQSADDFSRQVRSTQFRMRVVRGDVQMFLAMAHQELRNFSTALNWLNLVGEWDTTDKWLRHTWYLKGRNEEAMLHYDAAMDAYQSTVSLPGDPSPRDFGNVLRARLLNSMDTATTAAPANSGNSDNTNADSDN